MQDQTYIILLSKSFTGDISPAELHLLDIWKQESPENTQFAAQMKQVWESSANHVPSIAVNDLEGDFKNVLAKINQGETTQLKVVSFGGRILRAAAILVCLLAAVWTLRQITATKDIIETAQGFDQRQVTLPDGSLVWLRQNTTLTYSENSFNTTERRLKLEGEAYFEVTHNPSRPFRVEVANTSSVEVLGTQFDVKTSGDKSAVTVILKSGKVRFKPTPTQEGVIMSPNQKLVYDPIQSKITTSTLQSNADLAWQAGGLCFIDAPLSVVKTEIEKYYGIQVNITNPLLLDCKFTSPLPSKNAGDLLKNIATVFGMKIINDTTNNYILSEGVCAK